MEKKYYKSGLRPIIREIYDDYEMYYSFQWDNGEFKQDMQYMYLIYNDPSGDVEEITLQEFDDYVKKLKMERGL